MFNESWRCFLQQWGLSVNLWKATSYCHCKSLGNLGIPLRLLWSATPFTYNLILVLEVLLANKRCPFGTLTPHCLLVSFSSPSYIMNFRKVLMYWVSIILCGGQRTTCGSCLFSIIWALQMGHRYQIANKCPYPLSHLISPPVTSSSMKWTNLLH